MTTEDEALATLGLAAIIVEVRDKERERCAKIAEKYLGMDENWSAEIAHEIRKGE